MHQVDSTPEPLPAIYVDGGCRAEIRRRGRRYEVTLIPLDRDGRTSFLAFPPRTCLTLAGARRWAARQAAAEAAAQREWMGDPVDVITVRAAAADQQHQHGWTDTTRWVDLPRRRERCLSCGQDRWVER